MPIHRIRALIACFASGSMLVAAPSWAAGPWITDTGGADMGMAGAGRASLALDAASLAANPAALGKLEAASATVAVTLLDLEYDFRGSTGSPADATNQGGIITVPAAFAVGREGALAFGLGAYSYFGLSFNSGDEWGGERVVQRAGVATFNVGPAVAWSVNERFTAGASVAAQWARPELRLAVANDALYYGPPAGLPDGQLTLSGDACAAAGQLGMLFEPRPGLRAGLSWTAPVDHSVPLDLEARDVHPVLASLLPADGTTELEFTVPQQLLLGVSHGSSDDTLVSYGLSWQDWSALGEAQQRLPGRSTAIFPHGLRDTWGASVGVRHVMRDRWVVSSGIDYASSPAPAEGVPVYFPVAEQWKLAAGVERTINDAVRLRGAVSVILQDDADVVQVTHPVPLPGIPALTGRYEDTRVYVVALAADFRL